jgi:hypothetical protein
MQLKFSKKSRRRDRHSALGGSCRNIRVSNRSENTSGFQYTHLLSSTDASEIISWKEESPVFSFIHCMPFGEKIENPEEDPVACQIPAL